MRSVRSFRKRIPMGIEIERTFLVDYLPPGFTSLAGTPIRQGYILIAANAAELRIRQKQRRFFQTIKMGLGLSRTEIEIELSRDQFTHLWPHTAGRRLSKTRYTVQVGGHTAELDRFDGRLAGLLLVEVEFASVETAGQFEPPAWFGDEVTTDDRYSNKNLAFYGIPGR